MPRRKFTREFKSSAVKLVNEQGYSPAEAGKSLGIDPANVRNWVERASTHESLASGGEGALRAELRRLRKENARLLMEREILKKPRHSLRRSSSEVRLRLRTSQTLAGGGDLPRASGGSLRLLRLAEAA